MEAILAYILAAMGQIPVLIQGGEEVVAFSEGIIADVKTMMGTNTPPTAAQWAALDTTEEAAYTALQAAVPG